MSTLAAPYRGRRTAVLAVAALTAGLFAFPALTANAADPDPNPSTLETQNAELSRRAGTESMVLLENSDETLPLVGSAATPNVAVFGVGSYATSKHGTGAADVYNRNTVNLRSGFENAGYNVTTDSRYWDAVRAAFDARFTLTTRNIDYASVEQALTAETVQPSAATDTAVYIVTRGWTGGIDKSQGPGGFELSETERQNLRLVASTYEHVVVVLNTGSVFGTSFCDAINGSVTDPAGGQALDAILLAGLPGQQVGNAIVDVLNGTVNPSGKLTDTWASTYDHYPAAPTFSDHDGITDNEEYSEGIYVGYRYFDSFYRALAADPGSVVPYPFGHGLSYTRFTTEVVDFSADEQAVQVKVRVTNVGDTAGKEVAQIYFSAPQTGLDKPYQELGGYAKTDLLAPGESQVLTISFETTEMSSYDEATSSWVLDRGTYVIRAGDSSRNTHVAGTAKLNRKVVTEVNSPQLRAMQPATLLESDPANFYSYPAEDKEIRKARRVTLSGKAFETVQAVSPFDQNVAVDPASPYHAVDGDKISTVPAYLPQGQTDWEGTGGPYVTKTGEMLTEVSTDVDATLYDVAAGRLSMEQFVAGLSVTQLANIVEASPGGGSLQHAVGAAGYTTARYESLGIPSMSLVDGGSGLRITPVIPTDPPAYQYATSWPATITLAQSWDLDLAHEVANGIGQEMVHFGATLWLAPGLNIHRDPLGGRNWMYPSEDPLVSGMNGVAFTRGIQEFPGLGVTIKHFAGNNQETGRDGSNSIGHERGLRELELKSFELVVKQAQPMAVMTGYNRIEGQFAAENYDLNTDVLRGEWGFEGMVMSDWGGSHDALATLYSGNDLISPGNRPQDVIDRLITVEPTIDLSGLPAYNKAVRPTGDPTYTWAFGGLRPSATGTQVVSTTVDDSTDITRTPLSVTTVIDAMGNQVVTPDPAIVSVDDAYQRVQALMASTALTTEQKAGITVHDVVHAVPDDPTSPVTAYTVDVRGDYNTVFDMRLGDVQRSAINILDTVMQSRSFEQLASLQGVTGVQVSPYSEQFTDLRQYLTVVKGEVGTAPTTVADVASLLQKLRDQGEVRGPVARLLTVHIEAAQRHLDHHRTDAAVRSLERFIACLDHPGRNSVVTDSARAQLETAAREVISNLRG
ncbi:glycoside hydrolase family 3 C-terminal domain-containing protein [Nakamurella sp. GG22]